MIRITEILDKAKGFITNSGDLALIQKAYVFSAAAHAGQIRLNGEPYLSHPLEVANILVNMNLDTATIVAGLLHDTAEDTNTQIEEVEEKFGHEVAHIVDGVTKISKMRFDSKEEAQAENIRKMILAMADDIRVIMVKLADRLHNMRTLEFQKEIKQKTVSQETLDIYAPLANRLGLYKIKTELEDLSLRYTMPDLYFQIKEGIERYQEDAEDYINDVCDFLRSMLEENNISGRVTGRSKHIYSVWHKMRQQQLSLEEVHDLIAFRVIVHNIKDCYSVLGLVHSMWKPVPGRFKDYISMPKANMYRSLHTTVIGPEGERIEIQIRTEEMHQLAEYGVAAHWKYKESGRLKEKDAERFTWLRRILDWQEELKDPREFMASLRFDLFEDEVYVFTPQGEVKELPEGATAVDFAYMIHSEVGDHCAGAKVNGKLVPLDTRLKNGDTVHIITDSHRHPSRDWLRFVKTAKARTRIKHWIRNEERDKSIALAKEVLEKEGRKLGVNFNRVGKGRSTGRSRPGIFLQVNRRSFVRCGVCPAYSAPGAEPPSFQNGWREGGQQKRREQEKAAGRAPNRGSCQKIGRGVHKGCFRYPGPVRPVLQSGSRRSHCRLHIPRPGSDHPSPGLPECEKDRAGADFGGILGGRGPEFLSGGNQDHLQEQARRTGPGYRDSNQSRNRYRFRAVFFQCGQAHRTRFYGPGSEQQPSVQGDRQDKGPG